MVTRIKQRQFIRSGVQPAATIDARDVRVLARLRDIRQQIDAGTYLTDDKLESVVDCLCEVLDRGRKRVRRATA